MANRLTWHGHANFCLETPQATVYIDPFFNGNSISSLKPETITKADLILITHDHADHAGDYAIICKNTKARVVAVVGAAQRLAALAGLDAEANMLALNIGGTYESHGLKITMTEAFHTCEAGAPTGFIITLNNGFRIYHAGDTGIFPGMSLWGQLYPLDLALLPIGGFYTMDSYQAAHAADLLKCKAAVPMHWGTFPALEQNTDRFAQCLSKIAPQCRLLPMTPDKAQEI